MSTGVKFDRPISVPWLLVVTAIACGCSATSGRLQDSLYDSREAISIGRNIPAEDSERSGNRISEDHEKPAKGPVSHPQNVGEASWYGPGFNGKRTASGDIFDGGKLTAAHKTLPLGSRARVTNLKNRKSVEVEINDRGPFVEDRIIDLSQAAARALGIIDRGTARVKIELLDDETASVQARNPSPR